MGSLRSRAAAVELLPRRRALEIGTLEHYKTIFLQSFGDYGRYLWNEITEPSWHSYFYGLILVSVVVYALELVFPWRKNQPRVRKDFWLDGFYMFFNFFLFWLVAYNAVSNVVVEAFAELRRAIGLESLAWRCCRSRSSCCSCLCCATSSNTGFTGCFIESHGFGTSTKYITRSSRWVFRPIFVTTGWRPSSTEPSNTCRLR